MSERATRLSRGDEFRLREIHDAAVALGAECLPSCRLHVLRRDSMRKASADDPVHPGWPAKTPDGLGGKFRPKQSPILPLNEIPADAKERPVTLMDSAKVPVLDGHDEEILRPNHLPPEFFVRQGLASNFKERLAAAEQMGPEAVAGVMAELLAQLYQFKQNGSWDAQRIGGRSVDEYRDYATIAIGLYLAATGIPIDGALSIENAYAARHSHFSPKDPMDEVYTSLPKRNVDNTRLGYELYESGRISSSP